MGQFTIRIHRVRPKATCIVFRIVRWRWSICCREQMNLTQGMYGARRARAAASIRHLVSIDIISTTEYSASAQLRIRISKFACMKETVKSFEPPWTETKKKWLLIVVPCAGANAIYFIPFLSILLFHSAQILWIFINIVHFSLCYARMLYRQGPPKPLFSVFRFIYSYLCAECLIVSIPSDVRVESYHQMHNKISILKQQIAK